MRAASKSRRWITCPELYRLLKFHIQLEEPIMKGEYFKCLWLALILQQVEQD